MSEFVSLHTARQRDCCTCAINQCTLHVDLINAALVMCYLFTAGGQQTQTEQTVIHYTSTTAALLPEEAAQYLPEQKY